MTYFILVFIITVLAIISFYIFNKNILSLSVVSCIMFDFCTVMAWFGKLSWNTEEELSYKVIIIVTMGLVTFILGEYISNLFFKKRTQIKAKKNENYKEKLETENEQSNIKEINISVWKTIIAIFFIIITTVLVFFEIKDISMKLGLKSDNVFKIIAFYRDNGSIFNNRIAENGYEMNFVVKQMRKVNTVLSVIFMYIFINNLLANKKLRKNIIYIIPIIFGVICAMLTAGRALMMKYFVAGIFMYIYLSYKKDKKSLKKVILISSIAIVLLLCLFYFILPLLGRSISKRNIFEYISFYFGTSLASLNVFLKNMPVHDAFVGNETFSGVYFVLKKLGIINYTRDSAYSWVYFNGAGSNVYTSLKSYYFDFGFAGVAICQFVFGFVSNLIYKSMKSSNKPIFLIIFANYFYVFVDQIRGEEFFALISSTTISYIILFIVVYFLLFDIDIKYDKKIKLMIYNKDIKEFIPKNWRIKNGE